MSVSSLILAIAPAYANDARISTFTTLAVQQTSRSRFGVNYEYAVALRVCHMIARNPVTGAGSAGAVTSATEGSVSQSYSVSPDLQKRYGDLCSTAYGAQLAQLMDGNIVAHLAIGGGDASMGSLLDAQGNNI
jgi:hypothetical protein